MTEKCPTCRAPAIHEGDRYQFDSSGYHMDAAKKLSEISALRGIEEDARKLSNALERLVTCVTDHPPAVLRNGWIKMPVKYAEKVLKEYKGEK